MATRCHDRFPLIVSAVSIQDAPEGMERMGIVGGLITAARAAGRIVLDEVASKQLVAACGIPVVPTELAGSAEEAGEIARRLGLPAVLKLVSPDVVHKSDIGGVKLGLADEEAVARGFDELA